MSARSRDERLAQLRANPDVDVLIIGGGINGIGTFRDLALQGVRVALVERGDYCSGASAASSHMVHGGIRYLENGEFRLVREALHERANLLRNAPHLVQPLPTTIPIFSVFSGLLNAPLKFLRLLNRPAERGLLVIKAGLLLYDAFAGDERGLPAHRLHSRRAALEQMPRLNPDIRFAATYYDAAMHAPERIAVELLLDGLAEGAHAVALNYAAVTGMAGDTVTVHDALSGEPMQLRPRVVVNAGGAWIDQVNARLDEGSRYIGGTKGSHLMLEHPALLAALGGHELFFENHDGRIVLLYPLAGRVLVGTSDIPIDDPDDARITEAEIDYFFAMIAHVFPEIAVGREHVVYTFSGVRPLPAQERATTAQISRDHQLRVDEADGERDFPIVSLVGGKWTTYRAFSAQATDAALARLGRARQTDTARLGIGGGRDFPQDAEAFSTYIEATCAASRLDALLVERLVTRYGTRASAMATYAGTALAEPLAHAPDYSAGELRYIAAHEDVQHLGDVVFRRTMLAKRGGVTREGLAELARICGDALGWDAARQAAEVGAVLDTLREAHQIVDGRLA